MVVFYLKKEKLKIKKREIEDLKRRIEVID